MNRRHFQTLAVVWILTALYLLPFVHRGWIAGDEGLLAQSAERVLQGQLPHRDFDDMYTGGQAMLHAVALDVLGVRLSSLRWVLYALALLTLPLIYRLAARVAPPWVAGVVSAVSIVWTFPNYFAAMPSWYNLTLALAAILALLAHVDNGQRRWLFAAGLATGISFLIKSAALLLVAAVLLFFLFREQELDQQAEERKEDERQEDERQRRWAFPLFVSAGLAAFMAVLISFIAQMPRPSEFLVFVGPSTCVVIVLLFRAWRFPGSPFAQRFKRLLVMALPFFGGMVIPCLLFLIPYQLNGGLDSLLAGEFLFVKKRLLYTTYALPNVATLVCVLPLLALLLVPMLRPVSPILERRLLAPLILVSCLLVALGSQIYVYQTVWYSVRPYMLALALAGAFFLLRESLENVLTSEQRQSLFLLLAAAAVISVLQFPFAWGVYLCYVAPLIILATLYLVRCQPKAPQRWHLAVLGAYGLFAALWLNLGWVETHSWYFQPKALDTSLSLKKGDLRVTAEDAQIYQALVAEVQRHSEDGAFIFASPDCPEVYFLTDRQNPTRSFCDYFEDDYDQPSRTERLLALLDEHDIDVVVLHWRPAFSRLPADFAQEIFTRFPNRTPIPPRFSVHWRE